VSEWEGKGDGGMKADKEEGESLGILLDEVKAKQALNKPEGNFPLTILQEQSRGQSRD